MPLGKDEKGVPFMNFEKVNAKNLKDGIFDKLVKYGISLRF